MTAKILCLLFLSSAACADLRKRSLPLAGIAAAGAAGLAYTLLWRGDPLLRVLWSFLPGLIVLTVSRCTRGAIGAGDALSILILGFFYPVLSVTVILLAALFLVFLWAAIHLALGKLRYSDGLPFLPFLFAGFVVFLVCHS